MGQEAACTLRIGAKVSRGTALLESTELIFRGDSRLVFPFREMKAIKAEDGELQAKFRGSLIRFEVGAKAEKWAQKILHPPGLLDKLGVKPEMSVALLGTFEKSFEAQLSRQTPHVSRGEKKKDLDLIFCLAEAGAALNRVKSLSALLKPAGAIWLVYPKGRKEITEGDVLSAGRAAGLKDIKVCSFSATHTALKFVIPVSRRG